MPILPVDVQHSAATYRTEQLPDGRLGLRVSLADVHGITTEIAERTAAEAPYSDIPDFWTRARPTHPIAERLARIGALDTLAPDTHPPRAAPADRRAPPPAPHHGDPHWPDGGVADRRTPGSARAARAAPAERRSRTAPRADFSAAPVAGSAHC
ncbi:hypothetical protein GCM10010193_14290 [Kitasatospora atroaurantiaca]|uniref:helix-hairpin-helix domain-containing protein n=1 Tax=Kitasatospora atroaurantiaca TaxID=285545 RepID=UPI0014782CCB|nr:hypothetical protein [Kitasatospora atroaurantiaca]